MELILPVSQREVVYFSRAEISSLIQNDGPVPCGPVLPMKSGPRTDPG